MFKRLLCAIAFTALSVSSAFAQTYPSKPIKIVVPYPPGGFNDTLGRTLAAKFTEAWGQPAFVENKPGGNTLIGNEFAAKSPPDGYTLLVVAFPFSVVPSLIKTMPYDSVRDFSPVILAATSANLLVVHPSLPVKSVGELVALAKSKPGSLSYASTGNAVCSYAGTD